MIILSSKAENLRAIMPCATVEAEYGQEVVQGSILTLAHHGPRSDRPCPALVGNLPEMGIKTIGISHLDLDTLGGIMAIKGCKFISTFWGVVAHVDLNGRHKAHLHPHWEVCKSVFYSFWAWSEKNRLQVSTEVRDVTMEVEQAIDVFNKILDGDETLKKEGDEWIKAQGSLNNESFVSESNGIIVRKSSKFVNHLYNTPSGGLCKAVLSFNIERKNITLSVSDGDFNCCEIMQTVFGPSAGGHAGIAGSPRGQEMKLEDLDLVLRVINER